LSGDYVRGEGGFCPFSCSPDPLAGFKG